VLVSDAARRIVAANAGAAELLGGTRHEIVGLNLAGLRPASSTGGWPPRHLESIPFGQGGRYEDVWISRLDGTTMIAEVHVSVFGRDRRNRRSLLLVTDATLKHQLQTELIARHQDLRKAHSELRLHAEKIEKAQRMLERLNHELANTTVKLGKASQLAVIGELTAELAHQINNPLAAALSAFQFLEEALGESADEALADTIDILKLSLDRISETIGELKRVYRNMKPDGAVEALDLGIQIEAALTLLHYRVVGGVRIGMSIPDNLPMVYGRATHIQHTVVNLLDNAFNAVGPDGRIEIAVERRDGGLRLIVGDSGPGIPKELRERVLEPFFTTRDQGTGLGLSIVKRYLSMEGANLSIDDSPLGGAEFRVDFPAAVTRRQSGSWFQTSLDRQ
jgi:PAS domain S-box-containing protein